MNKDMENKTLSDDMLEGVNGGSLFYADPSCIIGADPRNPWEVIDGNGDKVAAFNNRDDAVAECGRRNLDHVELTWDQLCQRRRDHGR